MSENEKDSPVKYGEVRCPYLDRPLKGCFCMEMTSVKVGLALKYCGDDYRECPIYARGVAKRS